MLVYLDREGALLGFGYIGVEVIDIRGANDRRREVWVAESEPQHELHWAHAAKNAGEVRVFPAPLTLTLSKAERSDAPVLVFGRCAARNAAADQSACSG